ncbi:hypothetical protein WJX79_009215 [Trebouxia sp. C0005]
MDSSCESEGPPVQALDIFHSSKPTNMTSIGRVMSIFQYPDLDGPDIRRRQEHSRSLDHQPFAFCSMDQQHSIVQTYIPR